MAYGDVAELLGSGGPRQVGSVMSHYGSAVPWWRVLRASGLAPEGLEAEALQFYLREGTPLRGGSRTRDAQPSERSSAVVERLFAAGMVILGKTAMTEYGGPVSAWAA